MEEPDPPTRYPIPPNTMTEDVIEEGQSSTQLPEGSELGQRHSHSPAPSVTVLEQQPQQGSDREQQKSNTFIVDLTLEDGDADQHQRRITPVMQTTIKDEPSEEDPPLPPLATNVIDQDFSDSEFLDDDFQGPSIDNTNLASMLAEFNNNAILLINNLGDTEDLQQGDSEAEDHGATLLYRKRKRQYEDRVKRDVSSMEDAIAFAEIEEREKQRQNRLRKKKQANKLANQDSMFFPEEEDEDVEPGERDGELIDRAPSPLAKRQKVSSAKDLLNAPSRNDESEPVGNLDKAGSKTSSKRGRPKKTAKAATTKASGKARGRPGQQPPSTLNWGSLIRNDIIGDARANHGKEKQPGFSSKNKRGALAELISSIPRDHQKPHNKTIAALHEACKTFGWRGQGSMHSDGAGGWRLKGMKTSLFHYQLLGAHWIVQRENGKTPYGGMIADSMGYGKTLQMLACMVENQPKEKARNKSTLIVCPSSLTNQWMEQITQHCDSNVLGDILIYRAGSRFQSANICQTLSTFGVIITTYNEVMKCFPRCDTPLELSTDAAKDQWWKEYYERTKGPLLRIGFHRVVLDEAQIIKNHESRTSKACRLLASKYRWVITGTPLSNRIEEMFPYFEFLGVQGAASYEQFKKNFGRRNETCSQRLDSILRKLMLRRTGSDSLFDRPIVSLPALDHQTISLDFNPIERAIYQIVKARIISHINSWSLQGTLSRKGSNILTLMLRLRQICAHCLMVSQCMKTILEAEDLEKLWRLTEKESQPGSDPTSQRTAIILKRILLSRQVAQPGEDRAPEETNAQQDGAATQSSDFAPSAPASFQFRPYLSNLYEDGSWDEINARSHCNRCYQNPTEPRLAIPCGHLYCNECLREMEHKALELHSEVICLECSAHINGRETMSAIEEVSSSSYKPGLNSQGRSRSSEIDNSELSWLSTAGTQLMSTKTQKIRDTIDEWIKAHADCKIIVFTLFRPMIKVLGKVCDTKGWEYSTLEGSMNADARNRSLQEFKDPTGDKRVLLASMQAGGLGLNLTAARFVIICDLWWNEAAEDQAFSRVFRIGQEKDVEVRRFVINDAIDSQMMLRMQERKNKEINRVIDGRPSHDYTVEDLMRLFGPVERDEKTGMPIIADEEADDDEFVIAEDQLVQEDSDADVPTVTPARPVPTTTRSWWNKG